MNELIKWIKSNKAKFVIIIIIAFALPLIIIHLLFKWYWGYDFLVPEWDASDIISYIVGFETFFGTICLGIVAIYQTNMANAMNKRMLRDSELQNRFERQPSVMLADWKMELVSFIDCALRSDTIYHLCKGYAFTENQNATLVTLTLVNSSNIFLELKMKKLICTDNSAAPFQCDGTAINPRKFVLHIAPHNTGDIRFLLDNKYFGTLGGTFCELELILTNSMGERYIEKINFVIMSNNKDYLPIMINGYKITEFETIKE